MPSTESDLWKWIPKAAVNEQTDLSPVPLSQLKSNVISLDCHISQYATICQQLQAEVRSLPGEAGQEAGCPGSGAGESERWEHWGAARTLCLTLTSCAHQGL